MNPEVIGHLWKISKSTISKNKYANLKSGLSIWSFKCKSFPYGRWMKHKARICDHVRMQQWVVYYWKTNAPVLNLINVRSILAIASIHNLPIISLDSALDFTQADIDVDFSMDLPLGMLFYGNRG